MKMTAEIAALNKTAVALAADSAVTLDHSKGAKIYNSVNKIFTLSKYEPVGVMIYGNAEFMGVPWETIIKNYRSDLGSKNFDSIQDYTMDFVQFLINKNINTDESIEENEIQNIRRIISEIHERYSFGILTSISKNVELKKSDLRNIAKEKITYIYEFAKRKSIPKLLEKRINRSSKSKFHKKRSEFIEKMVKFNFGDIIYQKKYLDMLKDIAFFNLTRDVFSHNSSGVVIAGFGKQEIFPKLFQIETDGMTSFGLKASFRNITSIDRNENGANVQAFAQNDMAARFMNGIDDGYISFVEGFIRKSENELARHLYEKFNLSDEVDKKAYNVAIRAFVQDQVEAFRHGLTDLRQSEYVGPIIDVVRHMPMEELASFAMALVELTSIKRRVTLEKETVGGPIDVAIISKGDGFIWVKRKHYFDLKYNPHFVQNYFRQSSSGGHDERGT